MSRNSPISSSRTPVDHRPSRAALLISAFKQDRLLFFSFFVLSLSYGIGGTVANLMTGRVFSGVATKSWVFAIGATWAVAILSMFGSAACYQILVMRGVHRLRTRVARHVMNLSIERINEKGTGEFIARVDGDIDAINNELAPPLRDVAVAVIALLAVIPALAVTSPELLLGVVVVLAAATLISRPFLKRFQALETDQLKRWADHDVRLEEAVAARDDMRANGGQPFVLRRLAEPARAIVSHMPPIMRARIGTFLTANATSYVNLVVSVVIAIWAVDVGRMTVGQAAAAVSLAMFFFGRVRTALEHVNYMTAGIAALNRILTLLVESAETDEDEDRPDDDQPLVLDWSRAPTLEIRDLSFTYPDANRPSLRHVNLTVDAGASVGVIGRTGAGKTTLVKLLARIQEPPRNTIFLNNIDVRDIPITELRQHIGFVSQRTELMSASLLDNVTLLDPTISSERVNEAFQILGVSEWIDELPDGIDTLLGVDGVELSAGETQLVAFARLLVRETPIIVLDEATSRLDPITEARIRTATAHLIDGRTSIVIAHRTRTLSQLNSIVRVVDGQIEVAALERVVVDLAELDAAIVDDSETLAHSARRIHLASDDEQVESATKPNKTAEKQDIFQNDPAATKRTWQAISNVFRYRWLFAAAATCFGLSGISSIFHTAAALSAMPSIAGNPSDQMGRLILAAALGVVGLVVSAAGLWMIMRGWNEVGLVSREQLAIGQTASRRADVGRIPSSPGAALSLVFNNDVMMRAADTGGDFINFMFAGAIIALMYQQWTFGVGLVLLPAIGLLLGLSLRQAVSGSFDRRVHAQIGVGRAISNTIGNALTFKLFASESNATKSITEADQVRVNAATAEKIWGALGDALSIVPPLFAEVVVFWLVVNGSVAVENGLSLYLVVANLEYGVYASKGFALEFASTKRFAHTYQRLIGPTQRLNAVSDLSYAPYTDDSPRPVNRAPLSNLDVLELRDLTVSLRSGTKALDQVSLQVRRGELVVVCGAIGAGKTTLLRVLAGLIPAEPGHIYWNSLPVEDTSALMRPPNCAYAPQIPMLLSGSIGENIALDTPVDVDACVEAAALTDDLANLEGATTVIGHKGVKLSGGQIQRAALARALAQSPQLLLLDDVSSALDGPTEREIWENIRDSDRTVVATTYKRFVAEIADRVIVLDHGRVIADGTWADVGSRYESLFS